MEKDANRPEESAMPVLVLSAKECRKQELKSPAGAWNMPFSCLVEVDVSKDHTAS